MNIDQLINFLPQQIAQVERVKAVARLGRCREWTGLTLQELDRLNSEQGMGLECDAREVITTSALPHTFIRIVANGETIVWDGVGVETNPPFIGKEEDAPDYLRNSSPDILNAYRRIGGTY